MFIFSCQISLYICMCKMLCKILNDLLEEIPFVMLVNVIGTVPVQFYLHSDDMEDVCG